MQARVVRKQLTCTSQRTKSPALKALLGMVPVYRLAPAEVALSGQHLGKEGKCHVLYMYMHLMYHVWTYDIYQTWCSAHRRNQ